MDVRLDKITEDGEGHEILVYEIKLFPKDQDDKDLVDLIDKGDLHFEIFNSWDPISDTHNIKILLSE